MCPVRARQPHDDVMPMVRRGYLIACTLLVLMTIGGALVLHGAIKNDAQHMLMIDTTSQVRATLSRLSLLALNLQGADRRDDRGLGRRLEQEMRAAVAILRANHVALAAGRTPEGGVLPPFRRRGRSSSRPLSRSTPEQIVCWRNSIGPSIRRADPGPGP